MRATASPAFKLRVATLREDTSRQRGLRFPHPSAGEFLRRLYVLERATVFYTLTDAELRALSRRLRPLSVAAGEVVIEQDAPSDSIFFVEAGTWQVRAERSPGHSVALSVLRPGDIFGESCLFAEDVSDISVVALEEGSLLALDRQSVYSVFAPDSDLVRQLRKLDNQRRMTYHDMTTQANWAELVQAGSIIAAYSPKGGSGTSTVALNLAAVLARRHPREVVLVDLAFPYNHAALMASLVPAGCLAATVGATGDAFEDALLSASLYHPSGLMVLPGGIRPEDAELVNGALVARALDVLRRTFAFVVVDMGIGMNDVSLAVFDQAQHVLMVTTPELVAIKGVTDALGILDALGLPPDRVSLVLNQRAVRAAISREAIERRVSRNVDLEIRHDHERPDRASLNGVLLAMVDAKSEITRGAESLAERLDKRRRVRDTGEIPVIDSEASAGETFVVERDESADEDEQ